MNYWQIVNYLIPSDFITSNPVDDPLFLSYVNQNKINQNLPNALLNNNPSNIPSYYNPTWHPSQKLRSLLMEFNDKILYDHPSIPCGYCSILMMKSSVKQIDPNETYTLTIAFPEIHLTLHQGITLLHATVTIDENMFASANVAMSRAHWTSWIFALSILIMLKSITTS